MVSMMLAQEMRLELAEAMWSEMKNCPQFTVAGRLSAILLKGH